MYMHTIHLDPPRTLRCGVWGGSCVQCDGSLRWKGAAGSIGQSGPPWASSRARPPTVAFRGQPGVKKNNIMESGKGACVKEVKLVFQVSGL